MKLPLWAKWIWWFGLVAIVGYVLFKRLDLTAAGRSTPFDAVTFVVWVALLLAPIFSEVKIWGVELKQEIKEVKKDLSEQIHAVKAEVRNSINFQPVFTNAVAAPPQDSQLPVIRAEVERALNARMGELNSAPQPVEPQLPADVQYLFSARYNIEREVRRITDALLDPRSRTQIRRQVDILAEMGSIPHEMNQAIIDVYRICSPAVHGDPVSVEQVNFVHEAVPRLLATLRQIPVLRPD